MNTDELISKPMTDDEFLALLRHRLIFIYNESPNSYVVRRLDDIISKKITGKYEPRRTVEATPQRNSQATRRRKR